MKSCKKLENTLRWMKIKAQYTSIYGCSLSNIWIVNSKLNCNTKLHCNTKYKIQNWIVNTNIKKEERSQISYLVFYFNTSEKEQTKLKQAKGRK